MRKNRISLNEGQLRDIVKESVKGILKEYYASIDPNGKETCIKDKQYFTPQSTPVYQEAMKRAKAAFQQMINAAKSVGVRVNPNYLSEYKNKMATARTPDELYKLAQEFEDMSEQYSIYFEKPDYSRSGGGYQSMNNTGRPLWGSQEWWNGPSDD